MTKQVPHGPKELVCPLHKKTMDKVCHKCPWWTRIEAKNPQTGERIDDEWQCAVAWTPILILENAQQTRQAGKAVESMRNEVVKRMDNAPEWTQLPPNTPRRMLG